MGLSLLNRYKKIRPSFKTAFYATIIIGLAVHLYKFSNTLLNHDSLYNFYSAQNSVGSGRWFLTIACSLSTYFDLPWVNCLLSLLYTALTVVVIVALFRIENPFVIILSSGLLVTFPGITETFFFNFTADGYFLAMLLAAFGTYLSRIRHNVPPRWTSCVSCICICLSCGIYQAYVPFALVLAVCHLVYEMLENSYGLKSILQWIIRQILIFASAMAAYYLIWKLCMQVQGISASNYKGISEVANMQFNSPVHALITAIQVIATFFLQWNVFEHGITTYAALNILFLLLFACVTIGAIVKSGLYLNKIYLMLFLLCGIALVPFICIWCFASDDISYRPMMLVSISLLYIFTVILADRWIKAKLSNLVGLLLALIVFNNALIANISYNYMHQCNQRTFAESVEMMTRIHELQSEQEITSIAIIGNRADSVQLIPTEQSPAGEAEAASSYILTSGIETSLFYDGFHIYSYLKNVHGMDIPSATSDELTVLTQSSIFQEMDTWPSGQSMQVIDSTLIIKLTELDYPE